MTKMLDTSEYASEMLGEYFSNWLKLKRTIVLMDTLKKMSNGQLFAAALLKTCEAEFLANKCEEYEDAEYEADDTIFEHQKRNRKNTQGLVKGPMASAKKRTVESQEKKQRITQVIDDLYRVGKGFRMSYPNIAKHLIDHRIADYKYGVMLKEVKKIAPSIKQKYK